MHIFRSASNSGTYIFSPLVQRGLSKNKRKTRFEQLTDKEVAKMEGCVRKAGFE